MTFLTLEHFYWVAGAMLVSAAVRLVARPGPRWIAALFWALLGALFILGRVVPPGVVGYIVIGLVGLAASGRVSRGTEAAVAAAATGEMPPVARAAGKPMGSRIFWPALLIPAVAVLGPKFFGLFHGDGWRLIDDKQTALVALCVGTLLALPLTNWLTGASAREPVHEGGRLLDSVGWALVLPQLLAALGGIFAASGVGVVIAQLVERALPSPTPFVAVFAYCVGMAVFTMCLGNAFAAFAVITGGIGLPFVVKMHGGNPAILGAIGMLCGYCGTLVTPMAANFNLVPALLLELPDRHAVIKAQAPLAAVIFIANVLLLWATVYRF